MLTYYERGLLFKYEKLMFNNQYDHNIILFVDNEIL